VLKVALGKWKLLGRNWNAMQQEESATIAYTWINRTFGVSSCLLWTSNWYNCAASKWKDQHGNISDGNLSRTIPNLSNLFIHFTWLSLHSIFCITMIFRQKVIHIVWNIILQARFNIHRVAFTKYFMWVIFWFELAPITVSKGFGKYSKIETTNWW